MTQHLETLFFRPTVTSFSKIVIDYFVDLAIVSLILFLKRIICYLRIKIT